MFGCRNQRAMPNPKRSFILVRGCANNNSKKLAITAVKFNSGT